MPGVRRGERSQAVFDVRGARRLHAEGERRGAGSPERRRLLRRLLRLRALEKPGSEAHPDRAVD